MIILGILVQQYLQSALVVKRRFLTQFGHDSFGYELILDINLSDLVPLSQIVRIVPLFNIGVQN